MAVLSILEFPDPRLRKKAVAVKNVDGKVVELIDNLLETLYAAPGIGLAASQVNIQSQVIVIDLSEERNQPLVLVNPHIIACEGEIETAEGCLSVPGFYEPVKRAQKIKYTAIDRSGEPFSAAAEDLLAGCIQHEIDHLAGKLFVDYLSPVKRQLIRKKLLKQQKQNA